MGNVLELGSGTGQHACFFAEHLSDLIWQPTDLKQNLAGLQMWLDEFEGRNMLPSQPLDVRHSSWPVAIEDALFTANSLHIMAWSAVQSLFAYLDHHAPAGNLLLVYGPFNYAGQYTSPSNARFDQWLAQQSPDSAIRDFEAVDELAQKAGYGLQSDHTMPANNRMLVWRKFN